MLGCHRTPFPHTTSFTSLIQRPLTLRPCRHAPNAAIIHSLAVSAKMTTGLPGLRPRPTSDAPNESMRFFISPYVMKL
jgi:hypothetical protein